MSGKRYKIVGLGEVLFDVLPSGEKMLGGAPANFAYAATQMGNDGIVASRVGRDFDARDILRDLKEKGVNVSHVQTDAEHSTGTVKVALVNNQPDYDIAENAAWDFVQLSDDWQNLAGICDAVCFGTLAQRNRTARRTIRNFVKLTKPECLRIFDVNLRQNYFSDEILEASFDLAGVVKMNHEELPRIVKILSLSGSNDIERAKNLREKFDLQTICVTRGGRGSLLVTEKEISETEGVKVEIADTIGAGDAFTAALAHGLLRGWNLHAINEKANRIGAFVASKHGAMPHFPENIRL